MAILIKLKPYKITLNLKPSAKLLEAGECGLKELTELYLAEREKKTIVGRAQIEPEHREGFPRLEVVCRGMRYQLSFFVKEEESADQVATDLITIFHEHGWETA